MMCSSNSRATAAIAGPVRLAVTVAALVSVAGCARVPPDAGFADVRRLASERTGMRVAWDRGSGRDGVVAAAVDSMLARELTPDAAVQVALLNNRNLQATYEDLGVAQADLVSAGLLRNPVFGADFRFAEGGGGTALDLSVAQDFLDVLFVPLRRRVAAAAFEEAKLRVSGAVLDLAGETRRAFYAIQAAQQALEMRQTVAEAADASYDYARRLHAAGNITDLDLSNEQAQLEQSKLELAAAEAEAMQARERLTVLMGVWGERTQWTVAPRLPDVPDQAEAGPDGLERTAVARSLDLAAARRGVEVAGGRLRVARPFGVFEGAEVGAAAQREAEGGWSAGPAFSVPIPLFDRGGPAAGAAAAELRRARQRYAALAVEVRSRVRAAWARLDAARARAAYYQKVILPLRERIVDQTQRQFNAMQVSPFQLLQAKQQQVEAGGQYVNALLDYWTARSDLELILNGKLPPHAGASAAPPRMRTQTNGVAHD